MLGVNYGVVTGVQVSDGVMTFVSGPSGFNDFSGLSGIQLIPIPAAIWLLMSGVAGLGVLSVRPMRLR